MSNVSTIKYLTQDELKRLFQAIENDRPAKYQVKVSHNKRNLALFLVAYRHGLRASEVGILKLEDVNTDHGRIRIHRVKNSVSGEYPMEMDELKRLRAYLKDRKDNHPYLFVTQRGTAISRRMLDHLMRYYGKKADIPPDKRHFHVLRHSIATHLLDAGADLRFVQDWLGHANIQSTIIYAQITNKARDEQARKVFASPSIVSP
jgi:site-specific recombinase XerD